MGYKKGRIMFYQGVEFFTRINLSVRMTNMRCDTFLRVKYIMEELCKFYLLFLY